MFDFIAYPLGSILNLIFNYVTFRNYGLALIVFTLLIRLILLPLYLKQYKSTAKMQVIQPQIQEIQKRYKSDKEKLNQELMKVYQQNKVNPAGGCLPLLVQLPIIFSLIWVISQPLKFMLNISVAKITQLEKLMNIPMRGYPEIEIINKFSSEIGSKVLDSNMVSKVTDLKNSMNFLGLHLGAVPKWHINELVGNGQNIALLIIPILAVATTYFVSKLAMVPQMKQSNDANQMQSMQKSMLYIGPLMTLVFSFQFPAGIALYWIIGNIVQIFQQIYVNDHIYKKKEASDT